MNSVELDVEQSVGRWWRKVPLLLFVFALLLRLVVLAQCLENPLLYSNDLDENYYITLAQRIISGFWAGEPGPFYMDPLYGYFLAFIFKLGGTNLAIVRIVQILLDGLSTILIFQIGSRLWNRRAGCLGALLYAAYPPAMYYTLVILKTTLAVSGSLFYVLALTRIREKKSDWFLLGLLAGILVFLRANFVLIVPLTLLFSWFIQKGKTNSFLLCSVVFGIGLMTILSCGAARNKLVAGEFLFLNSQSGRLLYSSNNPENLTGTYGTPSFVKPRPQESEVDFRLRAEHDLGRTLTVREVSRYWQGETWRYVREQPKFFLTGLAHKVKWAISTYEIPVNNSFPVYASFSTLLSFSPLNFLVVAMLGIPGLIVGCWRRREVMWLLVPIITAFTTMIVFYASSRFRMPAIPFLLIGGGIMFDTTYVWVRERAPWRKPALVLLGSVLIGMIILPIGPPVKNGFEELLLARAYWAISDTERATEMASRGAERYPGNVNFPILLGIIALVHDQPAAAAKANQAAIAIDKNNATAYHHLGVSYLMMNQPLKARESIERALMLKVDPKFMYSLAETFEATDQPEAAVEIYRQVVALNNVDPDLLNKAQARLDILSRSERVEE
ncbi:MAG: glycosyltransferase family 39 protein [Proteobacteria bacterium]|nr:glycosyltransferase family 39 protein [Pseudomonadota bacterium]MBU1687656.1 glycosyltransferase family 39 protein [Pseudomonadota bacterium]